MTKFYDITIPTKFSRSNNFTPTKVTYQGKKRGALASPLVLVEGQSYGEVVRFRIDLHKRTMIDHPRASKLRIACKRLVPKILLHTQQALTA